MKNVAANEAKRREKEKNADAAVGCGQSSTEYTATKAEKRIRKTRRRTTVERGQPRSRAGAAQ